MPDIIVYPFSPEIISGPYIIIVLYSSRQTEKESLSSSYSSTSPPHNNLGNGRIPRVVSRLSKFYQADFTISVRNRKARFRALEQDPS